MSTTIVQYILLRSDLLKDLGWSVGSLVAQACHASSAVLHLFKDDEYTVKYLNDLDNMHKVVLEVPNEETLRKIAEKLKENSIDHKLWIEQPENIPTCLAFKPYPKEEIKKYMATINKTNELMTEEEKQTIVEFVETVIKL
ncbi:putative peptidyl-tRNA hydrolase PTRHD1 [Papilio machaon]|uniref:putative peptidyl-tRNA hydrolase PTRHD1 n=1 Tax=Papilio machaon TaxID=76193 RepID=UPI001E662A7D|nr:putative peptidyl-tRNA hydrolase PTRHD1 [Papilio machaon]